MNRKNKGRIIYTVYIIILLLIFIGLLELLLAKVYHFGDPVLYTSNALYGYRPEPNQNITKHTQEIVIINNLGIRANEDWFDPKNKTLFLGNSVTYGGAVSNNELFSILFADGIDSITSGSAGVNAWGVENIHALIVEYGFLPADTYITVLIEGDFYRGLQRSGGLLANHWYVKPKSAIHHVTGFFSREYAKNAYIGNAEPDVSEEESQKLKEIIVKNAVKKLKDLDDFLKGKGYKHFVFISPSKSQVYENGPIDELVRSKLEEFDIEVRYLLDSVKSLTNDENTLYKDAIHLNEEGHRLWARLFREEIFK